MGTSKPGIAIIIPAYNAEEHLEKVLRRILPSQWNAIDTLYIVNDGSTDRTREILDALADADSKIKPVHLSVNKGYGNAVKTGLYACRKGTADIVCCLHADGQYPPESIPEFVEFMRAQQVDILQGSRIASGTALSGGMPLYKYIAGLMLTFFENRVFGLSMTDFHSGFLFYSRRALETIDFSRLSDSFDFDLEVIASACGRALKIAELPIPARYADERSYLSPVSYGMRVVAVMIRYLSGAYRGRP